MTGPVLVVAHEATRTGSPRVLADLLAHTATGFNAPLAVRLLAEGPLAGELRSFASVDPHSAAPAALVVNGVAAASVLDDYPAEVPAMLYVHEEGEALEVLTDASLAALTRYRRVFCVSERARLQLVGLGVVLDRVEVLPPVVRVTDAVPSEHRRASRTVVVGCGEAGWRKGADLFIDVARRVREHRDVVFQWAGRRPRAFARLLDHDSGAAGLDEDLEWLGEISDIGSLLDSATLLVLPSREDPQPLVPLEAAGRNVATVGFRLGGLADLADEGAAATVRYPDTVAMASTVLELLDDPPRRGRLVAAARDRALRRHSVDVVGARFLTAVNQMLENR